MEEKRIDHMKYLPDMEIIDSTMLEDVLQYHDAFRNEDFTSKNVKKALAKTHLELRILWPFFLRQLCLFWRK